MDDKETLGIKADRLLIDKILYLADLVSQPQAINPALDTLRMVTAGMKPGKQLSSKDRSDLQGVYAHIQQYLIHKDPVRAFTQRTLQAQEASYLQDSRPKQRVTRQAVAIASGVMVVWVASSLVGYMHWQEKAFFVAMLPTMIALYGGIAWLFLSSLATFRHELRRAYVWMCAGMTGIGVGAVLWAPYSLLPEIYRIPIFRWGIAIWIIALSFAVIYVGVRKLGRASRLKSWAMSPLGMLAAITGASFLVILIPHAGVTDAPYLDSLLAAFTVVVILGAGISRLAYMLSRKLSRMYARAMGWLVAGFMWSAVVAAIADGVLLATGLGPGTKLALVGGSCGVASVMLFMAGYAFKVSSGGT